MLLVPSLAIRADEACFVAQTVWRGLRFHRQGILSPQAPFLRSQAFRHASFRRHLCCMAVDGAPGYDHTRIERKWRSIWEQRGDFKTPTIDELDTTRPKYYALDMFPYPSGAGLHVGHPEGYTATDIMARLRRKQGYNVLHPMGWDAFGLPAEQYALSTGTHPAETTARNISRFREQLRALGFSYDWSREVNTTDPKYYRWTQWIFLRLFEKGLAYQDSIPVNWCPALGTVLANEEVIDGRSERGNYPVERRPMLQWVLRITEYADRLLRDLEDLDWPESIKDMQRNWIGRSVGAELDFEVLGSKGRKVTVYTTRPETSCGVCYLVVAPEWDGLESIVTEKQRDQVNEYVQNAMRKSDRDRVGEGAAGKKTGVPTGAFGMNPINGESVPIWVADYVLGTYGTGAVMAVPAHDARDFEFAKAFDLPIKPVIEGGDGTTAYIDDGNVKNWGNAGGISLDGIKASVAKDRLIDHLEATGLGRKKVNYKLRDWLFSRQRYWGEPFPIVFVDGEPKAVRDEDLPVVLPEVESYQPSGSGESPLAVVKNWVRTVDVDSGKEAIRETNTMPQWAGSCWYYLRFIDPDNTGAPIDPGLEKYWMPVDLYVGGVEHAVLHLLYARFWHKVLYDIGVVSTKEPFQRLVNQGMILGEVEYSGYKNSAGEFISAERVDVLEESISGDDSSSIEIVQLKAADVSKVGDMYVLASDPSIRISARAHKMSKSRGNVVNPDSIIEGYGADALRCYLMFMGPLEQVKPWGTQGVQGMARFLSRFWRLVVEDGTNDLSAAVVSTPASKEQLKVLHRTIRRVTEDTEGLRFNTAIAALMEFVNAATKWETRPRETLLPAISMLGVFAPHVAEELWERLGMTDSLAYAPWPEYHAEFEVDQEKTIVIQVNGRVRSKVTVPMDAEKDAIFERAMETPGVKKHLEGMTIRKHIYVPNKLVNLVASK